MGLGGSAQLSSSLLLKNALAEPTAHNPAPAAKNFAAKGSPIRSEVKSAPKGNFNCLTRPDFLRGGSAGRERGRRELREATGGKRSQRTGDQSGEILALAPAELLQKGLRASTPTVPGEAFANHICSQNGAENKNII